MTLKEYRMMRPGVGEYATILGLPNTTPTILANTSKRQKYKKPAGAATLVLYNL
jgi:hypothetical protein